MEKQRLMLGMSFYKQVDEVVATLASFAAARDASELRYDLVLGLEDELPKSSLPRTEPGKTLDAVLQGQGWSKVWFWDAAINSAAVATSLPAVPVFPKWSYGSAVNSLLILARAAGCQYLLRVDPGVGCPPSRFGQLLDLHTSLIAAGCCQVVSGQYSQRLAIRDDYVPAGKRDEFYRFIAQQTGIDPSPGKQITGGAACTFAVDGPPVIPFDGARVWGSDDGFLQRGAARCQVQTAIPVIREAPGISLSLDAYLARVAGMVALNQIVSGGSGAAEAAAERFLNDTGEYVLSELGYEYSPRTAYDLVSRDIDTIDRGHRNYQLLSRRWEEVACTLAGTPALRWW